MIAIVEGRGMARGEIGLASIDLRSPTLNLSQFSDTQTYVQTMTKLHRCQPVEVTTVIQVYYGCFIHWKKFQN